MVKRAAKRVGKVPFGPVLRYFDRMFAELGARIDERTAAVPHDLDRSIARLEATLHEIHLVGDDLRVDARSLRELAMLAGVRPPEPLTAPVAPPVRAAVGDPLEALDQDTADLVNWVISPVGMAGEGRAWINHGANVTFAAGRAEIENLNERIIELPWAHGQAARLAPGSLVLDIGSTEGLLAMELATMGHRVLALDPRPYPMSHPNLEVLPTSVEDWDGPAEPLDAVFAISAIEHFGLGHYVEAAERQDLDRVAMERFAEWLRPGAPLLLTVPFGTWAVSELERIYDAEHLAALIEGWEVVDRSVFARRGPTEWERLEASCLDTEWRNGAGVALLELRQPG